jgi:uncharacterized sodium:solute symporter family permease YidK
MDPEFYYSGLNQFITQRTLAAKSLKQGKPREIGGLNT